MSFFGLTHLGAPNVIKANLSITHNINDYSEELFEQAFKQLTENNNSSNNNNTNTTNNSNNTNSNSNTNNTPTLPIDDIRIFLARVYNAEPPEPDIRLLTFYCDNPIESDRLHKLGTGVQLQLDWPTLAAAIRRVKALRADNGASGACEFKSIESLQEYQKRHKRMLMGPTEKFRAPMTTAQEIGWFGPQKIERVTRKPNISCEETRYASQMVRSGIYF